MKFIIGLVLIVTVIRSQANTIVDVDCPVIEQLPNRRVLLAAGQVQIEVTLKAPNVEDNVDQNVKPVCNYGPGPINLLAGDCDISCSATDSAGNRCEMTYTISVLPACRALADPADGSVSIDDNERKVGAIATYSCNEDFSLEGNDERRCRADSTWSQTAPTCTEQTCGAVGPVDNGKYSSSAAGQSINSQSQLSCNEGYTPEGEQTITCRVRSEGAGPGWGELGSCVEQTCGAVGPVDNGQYSSSATGQSIDSQAQLSCNDGYTPEGEQTITCRVRSEGAGPGWGELGSCVDKTCPDIQKMNDRTVNTDEGKNYATVNLVDPTATDAVSGDVEVTCNIGPGDVPLGIGPCVVTCTAIDNAGNECSMSYTITVKEACPGNYISHEGRCLQLVSGGFFDEACKQCKARNNGILALASNRRQSAQLSRFLTSQKATEDHYFNLHSTMGDGLWYTVAIQNVQYDGWRANPGRGECAITDGSNGAKSWGKSCCWTRYPAICEKL